MNGHILITFGLLIFLIGTVAHAKIVFSTERDAVKGKLNSGVMGIYIIIENGSNLTRLIEGKDWKQMDNPR